MAAYNKITLFTQDVCRGSHNFQSTGNTFNVMLTNGSPTAAHLYGDVTDLATGGGYTAGGQASAMSDASSSGTETVTATTVVWTGSGAGFGPFRYVMIYNNTTSSPAKPAVCWFDYGSSISLNSGDTFTVTLGALFTMT